MQCILCILCNAYYACSLGTWNQQREISNQLHIFFLSFITHLFYDTCLPSTSYQLHHCKPHRHTVCVLTVTIQALSPSQQDRGSGSDVDFNKRQVQSLSVAMHGLYKSVTSKKVALLPVLPGSTTRRWSKCPYSFNSSVLTFTFTWIFPSDLQSNSF